MQVEWYGQSAFRLASPEQTVAIDPFGDLSGLTSRGMHFDYPRSRASQPTCCS
jgi:L-ascorbate metabolism protein UlaG (beta-lactamase superfamily)